MFQTNQPYVKDSFDFDGLLASAKKKQTVMVKSIPIPDEKECEALIEDYEIEKEKETVNEATEEMEQAYEKQIKEQKYKNKDLQDIHSRLASMGYMANDSIVYAIQNAHILNKPILIEGEPGVGKTSLAYAYAEAYGMELIKVQFYNGITNSDILYEYDYAKQMLYMNAIRDNINAELKGLPINDALRKLSENGVDFFGKEFLIERPLLKAITRDKPCVLLLDEIDKSEEDIEFTLLEILDRFSITIPEYGTVNCREDAKPVVFLTSNRYRELSAAMKRRCLYLYIESKTVQETAEIISKNAKIPEEFSLKVAQKVKEIRQLSLKQKPSISDAMSWAVALFTGMGIDAFDNENIDQTLGALLKNHGDIELTKRAGIL